jgi:serine protease
VRIDRISQNRTSVLLDSLSDENTTSMTRAVPFGLDRIDQRSRPLDGRYRSIYDGTGVTVFVLDTGIRRTHTEFQQTERSVTCGFDFFNTNTSSPDRCIDMYTHGTHVAGIVGGQTSGVAKNVNLVAVKGLDNKGEGSDASLQAGIDYILGQKRAKPSTPMVVNMSFLGPLSLSDNAAVAQLTRAGVVVVAAAGNDNTNACLFSPGSSRHAITVGATESNDRIAPFSNYGLCVDLYAYVERHQ